MIDQTITRGFVAVVGLAYVVLAGWCAASPSQTSNAVGYQFRSGSGLSEYLVVYGGLQLALGLFFLWPLLKPDHLAAVLMLCLLLHAIIVAFRLPSLWLVSNVEPTTYYLAAIESAILLGTIWRFAVTKFV